MDQVTVSPERADAKRTKRLPIKLRGVLERDGVWWISWCCTEGHRHRQCIGPHGLAVQEPQALPHGGAEHRNAVGRVGAAHVGGR